MSFVIDASVTACWALSDEEHPVAERALDALGADHALAPSLWWFEVRNVLLAAERRNRLSVAEGTAFLQDLSRLPVELDYAPREAEVFRLARLHRLTIYDGAYLELAIRNGIALATLDADLARAARAEAVPLIGEDP